LMMVNIKIEKRVKAETALGCMAKKGNPRRL